MLILGDWPGRIAPLPLNGHYGLRTSDIPLGGDDASPLSNDGIPLDAEWHWVISSLPPGGTVTANDQGGRVFTSAVEGIYLIGYTLRWWSPTDNSIASQNNTDTVTVGTWYPVYTDLSSNVLIAGPVQADLLGSHGIAAGVQNTFLHTHNIDTTAGIVVSDFLGRLDCAGAVAADFSGAFSIYSAVLMTASGAYSVYGSAQQDFLGVINSYAQITQTFSSSYSVAPEEVNTTHRIFKAPAERRVWAV